MYAVAIHIVKNLNYLVTERQTRIRNVLMVTHPDM